VLAGLDADYLFVSATPILYVALVYVILLDVITGNQPVFFKACVLALPILLILTLMMVFRSFRRDSDLHLAPNHAPIPRRGRCDNVTRKTNQAFDTPGYEPEDYFNAPGIGLGII
jgi:hypothetical protein